MNSGIYKIENIVNGKCYIGSAVDIEGRWASHKSDLLHNKRKNRHLQNAYNKYGKENFEFSVVEYVEDKEGLIEREQYYIDSFDFGMLYNICSIAGSSLGIKHSDESKSKMSKANKGKKRSVETRQRMSDSRSGEKHHMFGKTFSEESKRKMSESKMGEKHHNYGKNRSEETKRKISETLSDKNHPSYGRKHSEETKKKMSGRTGEKSSNYGKKLSEETKRKMSEARSGKKNHMYGRTGENSPVYGEKNGMSKMITFKGKTQNIKAWVKEVGINYGTLLSRLRKGWPLERAFKPRLKK